jgi:uncharacterized protein
MGSRETTVILIGASVRAAAMSALRAGLRPWCADLFADADLGRLCPSVRLHGDYPRGFARLLKDAPPGPLAYTGGLENYPDTIDTMAAARPLWGNEAAVLRAVRSPSQMRSALRRRRLPCPGTVVSPRAARTNEWLLKPRRGAGGRSITWWNPKQGVPRSHYVQQFIHGEPGSAVFIGFDRAAHLVGITRQLIGLPWLHARPFQYAGSIGPWMLPETTTSILHKMAEVLVGDFRLRGLFGVDFILADDGMPFPVEVNPRYPASVEVLELACQFATLAWHRRAFAGYSPRLRAPRTHASQRFVGKAIWFAPRDLKFPARGPWLRTLRKPWSAWSVPGFADIPRAGEVVRKGHPVLTYFAEGDSTAECSTQLARMAAKLETEFKAM